MIKIRQADQEDAEYIFVWRNDPETRRNSFNQDTVTISEHLEWFKKILETPDSKVWMLEQDRNRAGQIRYDRKKNGTAEISIMVAPEFRGRNLGVKLIEMTFDKAGKELSVKELSGIVMESNIASIKMFEAAGFTEKEKIEVSGKKCINYSLKFI